MQDTYTFLVLKIANFCAKKLAERKGIEMRESGRRGLKQRKAIYVT